MDLIIRFTLELNDGTDLAPPKEPSKPAPWLDNVNADLLKYFEREEPTSHPRECHYRDEIQLEQLELCFGEGQYYAISDAGWHPLNDGTRIILPNCRLVTHIHNASQLDLLSQAETRYSEHLLDFDSLVIPPEPAPNMPSNPEKILPGISSDKNDLHYYLDIPSMVLADDYHLRQVRDDHRHLQQLLSAARRPEPAEGNILAQLQIYREQDGFSNYTVEEGQQLALDSPEASPAPLNIVDEIYHDNRQQDPRQSTPDPTPPLPKPSLRQRLRRWKQTLMG